MRISPIKQNQNSFKAVNQKYYQWAKEDIKQGIGLSGELLTQIEMKVCWKELSPQDAIDTIEAIKKLLTYKRKDIERSLEYIKGFLPPRF